MNYYTLEEQNNEAMKRVDAYRHAASLYPVIANVIRKFDGKVYNCRLEKALREVLPDESIFCCSRYGRIEIECRVSCRYITLCSVRLEDMENSFEKA